MSQEPSQDQPTNGNGQYAGRVLPGSRWRQRAFGGHTEQTVTVLRVGQRSVMVVIEGGKLSGHDRQKVGQRFNVILDTFLKTHTLIEQPKGYRPGDEVVPAPRKDTVETYFRRRRYAQEWVDTMEGRNLRAAALDPRLPIVSEPIYEGDALLPSPPPHQEEPMPQSEPSYTNIEQRAQIEPEQAVEAVREEMAQLPHPAFVDNVLTEEQTQALMDGPAEERQEPDPLEQFLGSGRAVVNKLTTELEQVARDRDDHLAMAERLDARYQRIKANRDRIESAVLAAMGAVEEPAPQGRVVEVERVEEEVKRTPIRPIEQRELPVEVQHEAPAPAPAPHVQRHGPVAATQGTQRSWVLDYARRHGGLNVRNVVDEFSSHFGVSQEIAVKNIVSILGDQIKKPHANWPIIERVDKGIYILAPNQPS